MKNERYRVLAGVATLCTATAVPGLAQTVTRVAPEAGLPGDLVLIEGTGLAGITGVGVELFIGPPIVFVTPLSVTDTEIWFQLPVLGVGATQTSSIGAVFLQTSPLTFAGSYFPLEQTLGDMVTFGTGGTTAGGVRPAIGFDFDAGPPKFLVNQPFQQPIWQNNPAYEPRLHFAAPSAPAILAVGAPDFTLSFPFGDGQLALNPALPFFLTGTTTDGQGSAELPLPVPAGLAGTVALQWFALEPGPVGPWVASNGFAVVF